MQNTNFKQIIRIRRGWLTILFYCTISGVIAQASNPPDSVKQATLSFRPKPVTGRSFILPAALITTGALGISGKFVISNLEIKEERDEHFQTFQTSIDNYLQYAPLAAGYGMLIGNKEHNVWWYTEKVVMTELIVTTTVQATKRITKVTRPDGSPYSFPSGHTAQAFASAVIFSEEFAQHKPWLAATAYTSAVTVGVLRVLNNKHWASDVIAGAGFGILSAKASEWIVDSYNRKHHAKHTYTYQF